jgi:cytochrome b561
MAMKNDAYHYGWVSRALHWIVFAVIATMLVLGLYFSELESGDRKTLFVMLHASLGTLLMAFMVGRLIWRWSNPRPENPPDAPAWTGPAATWVHRGLYLAIFAQMTIGVFIQATVDRPQPFFGLFELYVPAPYSRDLHSQLEDFHKLGWKIIAALVVIHVLAALYHHFVRKDFVLTRMITGRPDRGEVQERAVPESRVR